MIRILEEQVDYKPYVARLLAQINIHKAAIDIIMRDLDNPPLISEQENNLMAAADDILYQAADQIKAEVSELMKEERSETE